MATRVESWPEAAVHVAVWRHSRLRRRRGGDGEGGGRRDEILDELRTLRKVECREGLAEAALNRAHSCDDRALGIASEGVPQK